MLTPQEIQMANQATGNNVPLDGKVVPKVTSRADQIRALAASAQAEIAKKQSATEIKTNRGVTGTPTSAENRAAGLKSLTGAVTSIFPGGKVGEAIGTLGGLAAEKIKGAFGGQDNSKFYDTSAPSVGAVVGDVAKGAAMVGGLKMPLPTSSTVLGTAGKMALQTGALSAVAGGGATAAEGGDIKSVAQNAFKAGLTGAVIGGVAGAATKAISNAALKTPEALYNNALKVSQKLKTAGKSPSKFLADEGTWGSLGTMKKAVDEGMNAESSVIKQAAVSAKGGITYDQIKQKAASILSSKLGDLYNEKEIQALIDSVPVARLRDAKDVVPWVDADGVRSSLGGLIGDSKWLQTTPTENTQAAQAVYTALSSAVKEATGTAKEFARLSNWVRASKVISTAIDKADSKYGLGLYDLLSGTGGAVAGGLQGGDVGSRIKNALIGGTAGLAIERGINSPALKTGIAQMLANVDKLPTDATGRVSIDTISQLIGNLFNGTNQ